MAQELKVNSLTINELESFEVYEYLKNAGLIKEDELYTLSLDELKSRFNNIYTKTQIDAMEYITTEDIDTICNGAISYADEVKF